MRHAIGASIKDSKEFEPVKKDSEEWFSHGDIKAKLTVLIGGKTIINNWGLVWEILWSL